MVIVTFIDLVAFVSTFLKSFHRPFEETASAYVLSAAKSIFSIIAMESYSVITILYPASLVSGNIAFLGMLYVRRRTLLPPEFNLSVETGGKSVTQ